MPHRRIVTLRLVLALLLGLAVLPAAPSQSQPAQQTTPTRLHLPLLASPRGSSSSLLVSSATYLGGAQADQATGVALAPDGTVIVAGTMPGYQPAVTPTTLLNGSGGMLLRLDRSGRQLLSATRIGAGIADLELGPEGAIAVCGDVGLALLDPTASRVLWSVPGSARRCAQGVDGTVAALVGNEAVAYDAAGLPLGRWALGSNTQNDIAVDGRNQLVIVTGFVQISGNLQIPLLRGYSYSGELRWRSYDFPAGTPNLGSADSRGERIAIGGDGKLYFAGSINGSTGVSVFARDPKDTGKSAADRTVVTDKYTNPFNTGSVKLLWFARFDPANGELELAQTLLTRRSDDRGNSISAGALAADADGTLYLTGTATAFIANRSQISVAGVPLGPYSGSDAFVLEVSPDFKERRLWVAFTGAGGGAGSGTGIAVREGRTALAATVTSGAFITHNALQAAPAGASEGFLAVWE